MGLKIASVMLGRFSCTKDGKRLRLAAPLSFFLSFFLYYGEPFFQPNLCFRLNVDMEANVQTLPVATHLPAGYLAIQPLGLGKGVRENKRQTKFITKCTTI